MLNKSHLFSLTHQGRTLLVKYLALTAVLHLVWETVQLPLYTLWREGTPPAIAFAVVHCTLGDVLIAFIALGAAWLLAAPRDWPQGGFCRVALVAGVLGVGYTAFSEWNNTVVTRSWAYSSFMPTFWGIGLSPIAQWIVIPCTAWSYLRRPLRFSP